MSFIIDKGQRASNYTDWMKHRVDRKNRVREKPGQRTIFSNIGNNCSLTRFFLFENVHVFNCRSETRSIFGQSFFSNPILLIGTLAAQLIHIGAMYTPWISDVLNIHPVSPLHWLELLSVAMTVLVAMELHKLVRLKFVVN